MLQLSQRPLLATAADAALFVDRDRELEMLARAVRLRFNALVLGERGSGKTSLLHFFARTLREEEIDVRLVEASSATTVDELVALIAVAVDAPDAPTDTRRSVADDLQRLAEAAGGGPLVVLIDSIGKPGLVHELFGQQRDEVWRLPFRWVVTGNSADRSGYLAPPADSFFDVVVDLDELTSEDAKDLLVRRATAPGTADDPAADVLRGVAGALAAQVTPRTPRQLLSAARATLLADDDPTTVVQNLYALQHQAAALGRPAGMLFTELMNMGPVSASDEDLLNRLGWTRGRVVQVLKQLEAAHLVVSTTEARGQGRPRKLYEVNPHFHAAQKAGAE